MNLLKIEYKGWPNCYRMENGIVDLVMTTDVGPRIIRFGFVGGENEFQEFPEQVGKTGGKEWNIYGGHRLWHAPEVLGRTYYPDNSSVAFSQQGAMVRLTPAVEATTGIQKEIDIVLDEKEARATIVHRLWNRNLWAVELAPWALSVMDAGGVGILPFPPKQTHDENLLPVNTLTLWAFTDMSDPRWVWGRKSFLLRQDPKRSDPQKIGVLAPEGWIAYAHGGRLFVKMVEFQPTAKYPDMGCNLETYTDDYFLEVETVGPVVTLQPGEKVEHREDWMLFKGVSQPSNEADVERDVLPLISRAKK